MTTNTTALLTFGLALCGAIGAQPNVPKFKVNFIGEHGKKHELEGISGRYSNVVNSFTFDPLGTDTLYACSHAGLYRMRLLPPGQTSGTR